MCFCRTLIHYGKPIINVLDYFRPVNSDFGFVGNCIHVSFTHLCLDISVNSYSGYFNTCMIWKWHSLITTSKKG